MRLKCIWESSLKRNYRKKDAPMILIELVIEYNEESLNRFKFKVEETNLWNI